MARPNKGSVLAVFKTPPSAGTPRQFRPRGACHQQRIGASTAGPELRPDTEPLLERCEELLEIHSPVDAAQPKIRRDIGDQIPAPCFSNDLLYDVRWHEWSAGVRRSLGQVRRFVSSTRPGAGVCRNELTNQE